MTEGKDPLFRWGWLLFFAGIPLLHWSAYGLLLVFVHWARTRPPEALPAPKAYRVAVYGLLAAYGVSVIPAVHRLHALGEGLAFGALLWFGLTYAYRVETVRPGWWRKPLGVVPFFGVFSAAVGLYQNVYVEAVPLFEGRMAGVHGNPNTYSTALLIGLFLGLAALHRRPGAWRWAAVPYAALLLSALLTTGSRGAWVGGLLGMAVFAVLLVVRHGRERPWRAVQIALGSALVGVVFVAGLYSAVGPGAQARMSSVFRVEANQDRIELYTTMTRLVRAHPLFGVGMGNIKHRYAEFQAEGTKRPPFGTAHNYVLQSLGETGLFGLAFFLLLLGVWLVLGWPRRDAPLPTLWLYSLLAALLVRDLFDNSLTNFYVFFFLNWLGATLVGARASSAQAA